MAINTSEQDLRQLGLNLVDSAEAFAQMLHDGQVNADEFYLIEGDTIADEAIKLQTGRTLQVDLSSSSPSTAFDGTANVHDIGVNGILNVAKGGTGQASLTSGRLLVGNGTSAVAFIEKTSEEKADTVVARDPSGNFAAGVITASLNGNATSATSAETAGKLATGHTFKVDLESANASSSFDGTTNIHDIGVEGTLPVGKGGTGVNSLTSGKILIGNGTNAIQTSTPSIDSNGYIIVTKSNTNDSKIQIGNSNGTIEVLASTNRGLYDRTKSNWIIYRAQNGNNTYVPQWASKGSVTQPVYFNSSGEPATVTLKSLSLNGKTVPIINDDDINIGTITVGYGGTGAASFTSGALLQGNGTSAISAAGPKGSATLPIYIDSNGKPQTITSYAGNVSSAITLNPGAEISISGGATAAGVAFNGGSNIALNVTALDMAKATNTLATGNGGTGRASLVANATLVGNGTNPVKLINSASGAYYATGANVEPQFGTLPVAQGGTGVTAIANIQAGKDAGGNIISETYATKNELGGLLAANDAFVFKGFVYDDDELPLHHESGWVYKVGAAGTYLGEPCEIGDMIFCVTSGETEDASHWVVLESNIEGAVSGPTYGAVSDGAIAVFSGASGKILRRYTSAIGSETKPIYIDNNGKPQFITSYEGNSATATKLAVAKRLNVALNSKQSDVNVSTFDGSSDQEAITVTGTLAVSNGGTGQSSLTSGQALIGNGTGAVQTRGITNLTTAGSGLTADTNLVTANTLINYKGSSNWNTVGTITTGTWQGSTIGVAYGGTGLTSNPSMLTNLSSGDADTVFKASPRPGVTGTLSVSHGGTGQSSLTSGSALIGNGTNAVTLRAITNNTSATAVSASTNLITANTLYYHKGNANIDTVGTISSGTWQGSTVGVAYGGTGITSNPSMLINLQSTTADTVFKASPRPGVTGTLPVANGGTGQSSLTSGALLQGNGTTAVSAASAKGAANTPIYIDSSGKAQAVTSVLTTLLARPIQMNGCNDNTIDQKICFLRANRLAFLPADQIIIEKTTDGGTTWVDGGFTDDQKRHLFAETQGAAISLPLLNGVRNINCGLRITISGMKYNVPSGTAETQKYNYWNSNYIKSQERYTQLKEIYFWVSTANAGLSCKVERATGAASTTWSTIYDSGTTFALTGWSGNDYIRFSQGTFGGGTNQTSNYWNYRFTFFQRQNNGGTTLPDTYTTSAGTLYEIRGYGDTAWGAPNNYMKNDHMYTWDVNKNVTFPAKVTASEFAGTLNVSNLSGVLPVSSGGTGQSSLTSGYALIGNGTGAVQTRAILNLTSKSALGWNNAGNTHADNLRLVNVNTIAYWNGAYSGTTSNISYVGTISGGTWQGSTIAVGYGGTGITVNPSMLINLGSTAADNVFKASPRPGVTGTLPVGNGGTGQASLTKNHALYGNGTQPIQAATNILMEVSGSDYTLDTTGKTNSTSYSVDKKVDLIYNNNTNALDFVFAVIGNNNQSKGEVTR